jgi:DNA-binding NarL/FixJ family response regulator
MNARDGSPLQILVIAASSERRNSLAAIIARAAHARTTTSAGISLERLLSGQIAAELMLVDVDSPALSSAVIRAAEALPAGTGIITLADSPDPRWVTMALRAGINAILSREVTSEEMRLAILAAEAGLVLLHPSSAQDLGHQNPTGDHDSPGLVEALTAREQEVLRLVSDGLGNKEIAARLNISDHTVKFHISSILGKLGATSRTEAVSQGIRRGFIAI